MAGFRLNRGFALIAALAATALLVPPSASANTITVNSNADPGSGGICTLHDAIVAANGNTAVNGCMPGGGASDVIDTTAIAGQTVQLAGALPQITSTLDIVGPGSGQLTVTGQDAVRPISLNSGAVVGISGLTITHGLATAVAGAINNIGTLTLTDVAVTNSKAQVTGGTNTFPEAGGIFNGGTLHLVLSSVTGNTVDGSGGTSQNAPQGGGIWTNGTVTIDRSSVSGNTATAVAGVGATTNASGGGIANFGTLSVLQSTLSGNSVSATASSSSNDASGGAIANANSASVNVTIDRSTLTGNTVSADSPGSATSGGFRVSGTSFSVTSSTIAGNSAAAGANVDLGVVATFKNTIVSNPLGGGTNCNGTATSQGFNLTDGTGCGFIDATDKPNTNPMLDSSLGDNGGPTLTLALLTGSPAIDAGLSSLGETVDQRGLTRPVDLSAVPNAPGSDGTDIGAFEVQAPVPPPPTGGGSGPVAPDTSLSARIRKAKRKATFTFGSADPSASFMCRLDKRALAPCTSPVTFKHLRVGKHSFLVEAVNAAAADPTPATFKFKLKR
jgi:hypothetical protein